MPKQETTYWCGYCEQNFMESELEKFNDEECCPHCRRSEYLEDLRSYYDSDTDTWVDL